MIDVIYVLMNCFFISLFYLSRCFLLLCSNKGYEMIANIKYSSIQIGHIYYFWLHCTVGLGLQYTAVSRVAGYLVRVRVRVIRVTRQQVATRRLSKGKDKG